MNFDLPSWTRLWRQLISRDNAEHWFNEISLRYNEPHRHYHNAQHIGECLREFAGIRDQTTHPTELELALWLHDVIYDPQRSDNEDQSKIFAAQLLTDAGAPAPFTQHVLDLIEATKHNCDPADEGAQLIIDIDLSILGQPSDRFWQYEKQIRAEYSFVPDQTFRAKRAEILKLFLARPRIYHTDHFQRRYETQARANLAASISQLLTPTPNGNKKASF